MDLLLFIIEVTLFLATITFYYFKKCITNTKTTSQLMAPEPLGAWPLIGHLHLLTGQDMVARTLGAIADKHGPIFSLRLGSYKTLVVSDRQAIKECFTTNDKVFPTRPIMAVGKYIGYNYTAFALAPYGPLWRGIRKMVTLELLTAHRLYNISHGRASEVDHFVKHLYLISAKSSSDHPNKVVMISTWFEHLTLNITTKMLAGKSFSYGSSGADKEFKEAVKKAVSLGGVFVLSDAIPSLEWLDIGGYIKGMKQSAKEMDKVMEGWVQNRIRRKKESGIGSDKGESDFMDVMLSAIPDNDTVHGYKREDVIKATMLILIMAGSESTAETLIWALSLLLNNPHAIKIAQEELEANVGPQRWVQESDIKNLNYLQAIVKETLRLYSPGPLGGPREAIQDCYVGGYYVPKGTRLVVNLWKLMRDPNIWSNNPNEFRPERFLNEHNHVNFKGQCFEYIPFSSGRRMCPGMTFGLQVVQLTLARLIQGFDITTPMGEAVDMREGLGIGLPKLKPLEVILNPRLPHEMYENL